MSRIKYEIDPHNRLIAHGPGKFRTVMDGVFKLSDGNSLAYHIKKSDNIDVPQEVKFSGKWSLNEEHNLIFTLDKWNNQTEGNKLVLKTEIIDASGNEFVFTAGTRDSGDKEHVSVLKLNGAWKADAYNRLAFWAEKETGASDELVLRGAWTINNNNKIEYSYRKNKHSVKTRIEFSGHWDIAGNNRLSYILSEDQDSRFDFAVKLERVMRNSIECTIGIGVSPLRKKVILEGRWNIGDGTKAAFEINYGGGEIGSIAVKLIKTLSSGEAYVRFERTGHEYRILGGLGMRF
jgi:hypothetical protein